MLPVRAQACICPPRLSVGHLRACRLQMCSLALTCHADGRPPCLRLLVQQLQHPIVWTHPALSRQDHAVPPSIRSSTITDSIAERREGRERCSRASLPPCLIPSNPVCLNLIPLPLCVKLCLALTCKCDWAGQHYAGRSGLGADICPRRLDLFKRSGTPPSLSSSLFVSPSIYNPLPSTHTYLLHVRCSKANTCSSQLAPAFLPCMLRACSREHTCLFAFPCFPDSTTSASLHSPAPFLS